MHISQLLEDLDKIGVWLKENRIEINGKKNNLILFMKHILMK